MDRRHPKQSTASVRPRGSALPLAVAMPLTAGSPAALVAPPPVSAASRAAPSGFAGAVFDSVHDGPLVGAVVSVLQTTRRATTDEQGRYRIDSVPAGSYKLGL